MVRWTLIRALPLVLLAPFAALAGETTILDCNFNDKTVDELIGMGGASVGEPIILDGIPAKVRTQPFATPSLEMIEDWGFGARAVRFEFLDGVAVSTGTLRFTFELQFAELNGYNFYIREKSHSAVSFLSVTFTSDGSIIGSSLNDGFNGSLGTYTAGTITPVTLTYDLDALTFDLSIGTNMPLVAVPLGAIPEGIGAILIGLDHDADSAGTLYMDNLLVATTLIPEPVTPSTWSRLKTLSAYQPSTRER